MVCSSSHFKLGPPSCCALSCALSSQPSNLSFGFLHFRQGDDSLSRYANAADISRLATIMSEALGVAAHADIRKACALRIVVRSRCSTRHPDLSCPCSSFSLPVSVTPLPRYLSRMPMAVPRSSFPPCPVSSSSSPSAKAAFPGLATY